MRPVSAAKTRICCAFGVILVSGLIFFACGVPLNATLKKQMATDSLCCVWIVFKKSDTVYSLENQRAFGIVHKRALTAHPKIRQRDLESVNRLGARTFTRCDLIGALSARVTPRMLLTLAENPAVSALIPVRNRSLKTPVIASMNKTSTQMYADYGANASMMQMLEIPAAHQFIKSLGQDPGDGIFVGLFDNGVRLTHPTFDLLRRDNRFRAQHDFVEGTIKINSTAAFDIHGTQVLSLVAGYQLGNQIGVVYKGTFACARTENDTSEHHSEEENWVSALVWADSLGVDIVSSSLGYRFDFTDNDSDYTYNALDGKTTIIAAAAKAMVERGIVIVNAMGNDGSRGRGSISTPADVDGVVSVGSVDRWGLVSGFSSQGPTFDGRIKPDVCAPGATVSVVAEGAGYTNNSGTSFSTPLVSGIVGLIMQAHPTDSPSTIRDYLYQSSTVACKQSQRDSIYGFGVPNAYLACVMRKEQRMLAAGAVDVYVKSIDGLPLQSARFERGGKLLEVRTDSLGYCRIAVDEKEVPETLIVKSVSTDITARVIFTSVPQRIVVTIDSFRKPVIVRDSLTHAHGIGSLRVYPNVISYRSLNPRVYFSFIAESDNPLSYSQRMQVSVRSAVGALIWSYSEILSEGAAPKQASWQCLASDGTRMVPGIYWMIIEYAGEKKRFKILIRE